MPNIELLVLVGFTMDAFQIIAIITPDWQAELDRAEEGCEKVSPPHP